jgi:very-short-patch-repair endonuclease
VCIICPEHGEFWQTPNSHLRGKGCSACYDEKRGKTTKMTPEEFIEKAIDSHKGEQLDYSKVIYKNVKTKVCIICHEKDELGQEHGEFWQSPHNHLCGAGCPKCGKKKRNEKNTKKNEQFIKDALKVHGNIYDYSKTNYVSAKKKVCIICKKHGEFYQSPHSHLCGNGCPYCNESHLETDIRIKLDENNLIYTREENVTRLTGLQIGKSHQRLDFYVWHIKLCIECQGEQHFKPKCFKMSKESYKTIVDRDKFKYESLTNAGYDVVYFTEKKFEKYCKKGWYSDKKVFYDVDSILRYIKEKQNKQKQELSFSVNHD